LENDPDLTRRRVREVMTKNPITVKPDMLAVEAGRILREKRIDELPVVDRGGKVIGVLDIQDLLKAGLI
ncbi:MAG: CBS domain-containing protein, partial [Candidatus Omnitrophica bacterium]|nr:CBS domain-containing protein [Candidatus Omnitrophota bacterium]